jgi:D-aspartate ligase
MRNSKRPYAVLIGLESMQGLQSARILADHQVPVIAYAQESNHPHTLTNVCEEILFAQTDQVELITQLESLGKSFSQKAVLIPCQDNNVFLVSKYRTRLQDYYHIALPPHDIVEMLMDKLSFTAFAQKQGLSIPKTCILRNEKDVQEAAKELNFPAVLKPTYRSSEWEQNTTLKAFKLSSTDELMAHYQQYRQWTDEFVLQEWIEGSDANLYSCNCYFDAEGNVLATFIARKLRQWPPKTGQSCLGEECRDDTVLQESLRLFRSVNYHGLGYVEIKRDQNSGKYFVVEPNIGRPTGRSAIAEAGGVELLYTMYCDVAGLPLPENREQTYQGVKWVHLRRDFQSAMYYWRHGELSLKDWWRSLQGRKAYAVFSWRDKRPFIADLFRSVRLILSSEERKRRSV